MNATTTKTQRQRFLNWIGDEDGQGDKFRLKVQTSKNKWQVDEYWIDPLVCEFGERAFQLEKCEGLAQNTVYNVLLGSEEETSCDCKGFTRWRHCKHVDACRKLIELQLI